MHAILCKPRRSVNVESCKTLHTVELQGLKAERLSPHVLPSTDAAQGLSCHTDTNSLVHDWNDETPVAVGRQELQIYEVIDEAIPVAVGQVDSGAHHGLPV